MQCKRCQSGHIIKRGFMNNKQRYFCKVCNYHFTIGDARKLPNEVKRKAIILYLEGVGFRAIERILKKMGHSVSHVAIIKWVKSLGSKLQVRPSEVASTALLELNETWHFVKKKHANFGFGLHIRGKNDESLLFGKI